MLAKSNVKLVTVTRDSRCRSCSSMINRGGRALYGTDYTNSGGRYIVLCLPCGDFIGELSNVLP